MVRHKRINEPDIRYDGQNLFQLNATPDLPKYTSGFINDVNGWSGGTKPENVGQVSELIKRFREEHPQGTLEDWKTFHHTLTDIQVLKGRGNTKRFENVHMNGIEQGVHDIMAKMDEVKNNINQLTEKKSSILA